MSRKFVFVFLGVLLLVVGGVWFLWWRSQPRPLAFYGTVETDEVRVGSLVGGRVMEVQVKEGQAVTQGQVVVQLDDSLLAPQIAEQEARVKAAEAALTRVEAGPRQEEVERARLEWQLAERERKRLQELLSHQAATQREYDTAADRAAVAWQSYQELRRGSRPEDIAEARATLTRERRQLAYLQQQRRELVVRSPVDGVVQTIDLRPGDLVQAYKPVASILEPDQLWVRVYVPETRLGLVHVGQRANVYVDTFPNRAFAGRVEEISDQGEYTPRNIQTLQERQELVFGVKIDVEPTPVLKAGMTAKVKLLEEVAPPNQGKAKDE